MSTSGATAESTVYIDCRVEQATVHGPVRMPGRSSRPADFAAALAATPHVSRQHFGGEQGPWKVAGLAWWFKDGLFTIEGEVPPVKRYWAGGFLWRRPRRPGGVAPGGV